MGNDYIPRPAARLHAWQDNFVTYVNGHLADLGLATGDLVDLNNCAGTCTSSTADRSVCAARRLEEASNNSGILCANA